MKIECVLTGCNMDPTYYEFIPLFIKSWKKLMPEINVIIVLIADAIPISLSLYSNHIILFKPIENVSDKFISQYIRLLYPALLSTFNNGGILLTDIDMMPLNSIYFTEAIKNIPGDKFICYRDELLYHYKEVPICYNVACANIYKKIFNINCEADVIDKLKKRYMEINYDNISGGSGWSADQKDLYTYLQQNYSENTIYLTDTITGFKRLDRSNLKYDTETKNGISDGKYSDYHACRPYSQYKTINDEIVSLLPDKLIYCPVNYLQPLFLAQIKDRFNIYYIIEAGARDGNDSISMAKYYPNSKVHTFECNPDTVELCRHNTRHIKSITFNGVGLGNVQSKEPFYSYKLDNPGASSLLKRIDFDSSQKETGIIELTTIEKYVNENNIPFIDLLCMDVQGFELNILKGAKDFIHKIKYIILEEPKEIINTTYLPEGIYSKYINAPSAQDIKLFMDTNNFIEIARIQENEIEDNVMYMHI
jgi:FkbM family methyltransferase